MEVVVQIPVNRGVRDYTVRRDRAEYSVINLEYYNGRWLLDNSVAPEERKNIDISRPLVHPAAFAAKPVSFDVRLGGVWYSSNTDTHPFARIDRADFGDRIEFYFIAKGDDPNATVVARILLS